MRKVLSALIVLLWALSIGAERMPEMDFEAAGFQEMNVTAYILQGTTANGGTTRPGICASSIDHMGDLAIVYTLDGNYLGTYEVTDTGAEGGGVRAGTVLDLWRKNRTQAEMLMRITGGKAYVRFISGKG